MPTTLARAAILDAHRRCMPAAAPAPPLFTRNDAVLSAAFLAGAIALSTAGCTHRPYWNEPAHRSPSRDNLAKNFAKIRKARSR